MLACAGALGAPNAEVDFSVDDITFSEERD
jgi:hypothetical protein